MMPPFSFAFYTSYTILYVIIKMSNQRREDDLVPGSVHGGHAPAFAWEAAFAWFVAVIAGLVLRTADFGVTSMVRALVLSPACYNSLLNFFRSSAWRTAPLAQRWREWLMQQEVEYRANGAWCCLAIIPKRPRTEERYRRCVHCPRICKRRRSPPFSGDIIGDASRCCLSRRTSASPRPSKPVFTRDWKSDGDQLPKTVRIVQTAREAVAHIGEAAYLLVAYFAVGPVFKRLPENSTVCAVRSTY